MGHSMWAGVSSQHMYCTCSFPLHCQISSSQERFRHGMLHHGTHGLTCYWHRATQKHCPNKMTWWAWCRVKRRLSRFKSWEKQVGACGIIRYSGVDSSLWTCQVVLFWKVMQGKFLNFLCAQFSTQSCNQSTIVWQLFSLWGQGPKFLRLPV